MSGAIEDALSLLIAGMPLIPLGFTLVNLATWRLSGATPRERQARVSALVPARNEQDNIEACVRALLTLPVEEVIVCDDGSTDETPAILARLAKEEPRLKVIRGQGLPPGWVGKTHACHQLSRVAAGDVLLFVDADTRVKQGALSALLSADADVLTAFPAQQIETLGEALIVSLLHLTYLSWLPLALIPRVQAPSVLAANGQVLLARRAAYDRIGGHAAIAGDVVDDMAFCRLAKRAGLRVDFVPGDAIASCRMYRSGREAFFGFSKNLYPGLGSPLLAAVVAGLYFGCFVLPWLSLPLLPLAAGVGIAANLLQRALIALRFRLPSSTVAGHLPSALLFLAILAVSARWSFSGAVRWKGRVYGAASAQGSAP